MGMEGKSVTSTALTPSMSATNKGKKVGTGNGTISYADSVKVNTSSPEGGTPSLINLDAGTKALLSKYKTAVILIASYDLGVIQPTLRAMIPQMEALGLKPILVRNAKPSDLRNALADKDVGVIVTIGHGGSIGNDEVSAWKFGNTGKDWMTYSDVSKMVKEIPGFEKKPLWLAQGCNTAVTKKGDSSDPFTHVFAEDATVKFYGTNKIINGYYAEYRPVPSFSPDDLKHPAHSANGIFTTITSFAHDLWFDNPKIYPKTAGKTKLDPPVKETDPLWKRLLNAVIS